MYELRGKKALVTGGASGLGACFIEELIKYDVAKCAILDIDTVKGEEAVKKYGKNRVMFVKCDVSNQSEMEAAFKAVVDDFKKLDIVINNAGVINEAQWEKMISINMIGVIIGTNLGLKYMGKREGGTGGTIVNIASILGFTPMRTVIKYIGTKYAVIGMTRCWALSYDKTGVRMLTLCPGVTTTNILTAEVDQEILKEAATLPIQNPYNVSGAMVHILKNGKNGSVHVSENDQPVYEIHFQKIKK